jgi:hypothetical protein
MTARKRTNRLLSRKELAEVQRDLSAAEAACSPPERRFCHWLMQLPPKHGFKQEAARLAGYRQTSPHHLTSIVADLLNRQRVIDLIAELTRKQIRSAAPDAVATVMDVMVNGEARDRLRAANIVLERVDPTVQRLDVNVKHEVVDRDKEAVAYLRKLRSLNVSREKLEEELGYSDLPRYERLLELEDAAKSGGKVIEADYSVVEPAETEDDAA